MGEAEGGAEELAEGGQGVPGSPGRRRREREENREQGEGRMESDAAEDRHYVGPRWKRVFDAKCTLRQTIQTELFENAIKWMNSSSPAWNGKNVFIFTSFQKKDYNYLSRDEQTFLFGRRKKLRNLFCFLKRRRGMGNILNSISGKPEET